MTNRIIDFNIKGQILTIATGVSDIVANSRNYLKARFNFDDTWTDISNKTVVFDIGSENVMVLLDADNSCKIPNRVSNNSSFKVSIFGDDRITTNAISLRFTSSGDVPEEPTGDDVLWYNQIMERMDKLDTTGIDVTNLATKTELSDAIANIDLSSKADVDSIPTKVSALENDSNYQTKTEVDTAIANITIDTSTLAKATELAEEKSAREKADTTLQANIDKLVIPTKVSELSNDSKYQTDTDVSNAIASKADTSIIPTKTSQLTNDSNFSTKQDLNIEVSNAISALDFSSYASKEYVDEQILASSTGEIDLSQYATKAEVTSATNYLNATSKPQINNVELVGNKSLADLGINIPTNVSQLTNDVEYQTKAQVTSALAEAEKNLKIDAYTKSESDAKVTSLNNAIALKANQTEVDNIETSIMATATDMQGQIDSMKTQLTQASDKMTTSLTNMGAQLTNTADSINARYDELVANVTTNLATLNATDATLRSDIDTINTKIPNSASSSNMLADKAYVDEQIKSAASRAISSDVNGNGFASLDALNAGPWYSLGVSTTPEKNDYAVVKKDTTHSGNDVRYNYDGSVWVFFQEFTSGSSWTPTTAESLALASGITAEKVALIDTNKASIDSEATTRSQADTALKADIATEASTRETNDNNLSAALSAEKLARENGDNQVLSKVTDEETARINAINTLQIQLTNAITNSNNQRGDISTLMTEDKTSVVNAINEVHDTTYTKEETDTILTTQYATKFDTLTASLTARCNAIEQDVATLKSMTATTKYLNKAGEFGLFASGNTKTMGFSDTNLKANEIALRHDTSNINNTMTDKDYCNGIIDNVQKCWFTDNTDTTGLTFHYLYAGGSGRCVFEMTYVATGEVIGYIVIGTSYWQSMTVDDITWSKTIYS